MIDLLLSLVVNTVTSAAGMAAIDAIVQGGAQ